MLFKLAQHFPGQRAYAGDGPARQLNYFLGTHSISFSLLDYFNWMPPDQGTLPAMAFLTKGFSEDND
jgi:hypothetical protein